MSLFSLIAVLLVEQIRPLPYRRVVREPLDRLEGFVEHHLNGGERSHGLLAWLLVAGGFVLFTGAVHFLLLWLNPLLAWLWSVLILYLTMGFRQFSHFYNEIQFALRIDDIPQARKTLAQWRGYSAEGLSSSEVARLSIEEALVASHRHVFGVLLCFVLFPGPCGAILYRVAAFLAEVWGGRPEGGENLPEPFGLFARQAFAVIDWLPSRVTAAGFAIVGDFEDAVYCWRSQSDKWPDRHGGSGAGIVLASGAGALGVRLGMPVVESGEVADRTELGLGDEADADFMQSAVGLVWRALLLWLLLLLLLGLATLVA